MAGGGSAHVQRELRQFAAAGLAIRAEVGNQVRYRANTNHPLFPELRGIVLKTVGLVDVLREALKKIPGIAVAFVYGSLAKGESRADSDVDVLVVGDMSFAEIVDALTPAQTALRREVNPTVYSLQEFRNKVGSHNHFLSQVMKGPKLFVIGDEHDLERMGSLP
jgi:predicted nucleotidyltransferase